jgi:hypothetical protein
MMVVCGHRCVSGFKDPVIKIPAVRISQAEGTENAKRSPCD